MKPVPLSQVVDQFFVAKKAERRSVNTLNEYSVTLRRFRAFFTPDDPLFPSIVAHDVRIFLGKMDGLSNKTVKNAHTALASMWSWALTEEICDVNIMRLVKCAKPEKRAIIPYTKEEFEAMLAAAGKKGDGPNPWRATPRRDVAILLVLLDSGVRASELCGVCIQDIISDGLRVFGKGRKERVTPLSALSREAIERYLKRDRNNPKDSEPLFVAHGNRALTRSGLLQLVERVAERAGVRGADVHRFRHTSAINFLRNGGDIYSLQDLLGHTSLDTVKIYLRIAQVDVSKAHKKASPVTNWDLKLPDDSSEDEAAS